MNKNSKNSQTSQSPHDHSLRSLLRDVAREAIGEAPVRLEVDVPADASFPVAPQRLAELVAAMVRGALDCLPSSGEITLTYWQAGDSCEIEVADNGPAIDARPRRLPLVAASLGAELVWQNCPQGGAAVTARLRRSLALREAA